MLQKSEFFKPIDKSEQDSEFIAMEPRSFWHDVWDRFRSNRRALIGLIVLLFIVLLAVIGPFFSPYPYDGMGTEVNCGPSAAHWFGTDALGRDLFTRVLYGIRISLFVGFVSTLINCAIGVLYGGVAGYVGGRVDAVMMRFVDVLYAVPSLLYIILLMMMFGSNVGSIMLGMCISGWVGIARLMRTQVISLKGREYPHEFSGGQRQRIGIARTLALDPDFIICDEPISALDVSIQAQIINLLEKIQDENGLSYLFIAHDLTMVRHISHKIGVMYLGHLLEFGDADEVYENPLHPYTRALISAAPVPDPEQARTRHRIKLTGEVPSPIHAPAGCPFCTRCPECRPECLLAPPVMANQNGHKVACYKYV